MTNCGNAVLYMNLLRDRLLNHMKMILRSLWSKMPAIHSNWLVFVLFYAVFANLPFWIASWEFGFIRYLGWFCTEFILIGLLALVVPPIIAATLLLMVISLDMLCAISESYNIPVSLCLSNLYVFHTFTVLRAAVAIVILLLTLIVFDFAIHLSGRKFTEREQWRSAICLIVFAGFGLFTYCLTVVRMTGHIPNPLRTTSVTDGIDPRLFNSQRVARFPVVHLMHLLIIQEFRPKKDKEDTALSHSIPSASFEAIQNAGIGPEVSAQDLPNVVLVLVESWGFPIDFALHQALVEPYLQAAIQERYRVVQGTVPFHGATVSGEARELCGSSMGFHLLSASAEELKSCLPARLAALGYHVLALHGMDGAMFSRSNWYRIIGFQELWFNDRFVQQGMPNCIGAFVGTCDAAVATWIGQRLDKPNAQPYFLHWMTLNSHLPVIVPSPLSDGAPCLPSIRLAPRTPLCSWFQLVANVHRSVSKLATGSLARPTVFIIVGDHAPPFVDSLLRNRFSSTLVPYILLLPRPSHNAANRNMAHTSRDSTPFRAKVSGQAP